MTAFAVWLNTVFGPMDTVVAQFFFGLHEGPLGGFFDFFFPNITHLGDEGLFFIALGVVFLLFPRTRKAGAAMLIALLFGLFLTNMTIKPLVERPRPYVDELGIFREFWAAIGHGTESESGSFPSGHATSAFAAMFAFFWALPKKYSWTGLVFAAVIGMSRLYIHVHYCSDVLAGMVVGFVCGTAAYLIFHYLEKRLQRADTPAARFVLNSSVKNLFKKA